MPLLRLRCGDAAWRLRVADCFFAPLLASFIYHRRTAPRCRRRWHAAMNIEMVIIDASDAYGDGQPRFREAAALPGAMAAEIDDDAG